MRLEKVLHSCALKAETLAPEQSLAEAARAICRAETGAVLVDDGKLRGLVTAEDVLRTLVAASAVDHAWNGPLRAALHRQLPLVTSGARIAEVVETMAAAGVQSLPVTAGDATLVVNLTRLLQIQINSLHDEVQHLQTYIDALHDAPND